MNQIVEDPELVDLIDFAKTIKVLYIENDDVLRKAALGVFKIFFENIDNATDGLKGLEKFYNNRYNLIITDLTMPNMDGLEMISTIRKISKDVTILVISSESDHIYFLDLIKLGIDGYILKPIKIDQFEDVFRKTIFKFKRKQEHFEYKKDLEKQVSIKTAELQAINEELLKSKQSLLLLNSTLEKRVNEEVEKNIKKEKLLFEQSKMVSMGEMIGNIAHQWRQPLSVISTGATGLKVQKEYETLTDELFYEACDAINDNAQYLSKTIDDFKNFIKGDRKKLNFDLSSCIQSVLNLVDSYIKTNNIKMILNLQKDIGVIGYPNELTQAIINIINNSKDALANIDESMRYINIETSKDENSVIIKIKDSGGGIDQSIIKKIFEPYFTTKHQSKGTGLGLSMSYNLIVDGMGGNIEVKNGTFKYDNKELKGVEFTISLPLV